MPLIHNLLILITLPLRGYLVLGNDYCDCGNHISSKKSSAYALLNEKFWSAANTKSDIFEHVHTLRHYSTKCESILELGVGNPISTYAFLHGLFHNSRSVKKLHSVDIQYQAAIESIYGMAQRNGIEFSFEVGNDLDQLRHSDPVDMTYIDTWHVYGQLMRELIKFSRITKRWIVIPAIVSDGYIGQSIRDPDKHNITEEIYRTGYSPIDIVKGLRQAIADFIDQNKLEWGYEVSRLGNNGLIVLQRISGEPWLSNQGNNSLVDVRWKRKSDIELTEMFLVTSILDTPHSIYSVDQRYGQTVATVQSILKHYPKAVVVILDGSRFYRNVHIPGSGFEIQISNPERLITDRGVGETHMLQEFIGSDIYQMILPYTSHVYKMSARYYFLDDFNPAIINPYTINARHTPSFGSNVFETMVYSYPPNFSQLIFALLTRARETLQQHGGSIENILFADIGADYITRHLWLGVEGLQAPTGLLMRI